MSTTDVTTPSRVPNCESMPRVKSIRKNSTDQNWAPGNWFMASVKIMKANPVPEAVCEIRSCYVTIHQKEKRNIVRYLALSGDRTLVPKG
jgi:hypothetical protein